MTNGSVSIQDIARWLDNKGLRYYYSDNNPNCIQIDFAGIGVDQLQIYVSIACAEYSVFVDFNTHLQANMNQIGKALDFVHKINSEYPFTKLRILENGCLFIGYNIANTNAQGVEKQLDEIFSSTFSIFDNTSMVQLVNQGVFYFW